MPSITPIVGDRVHFFESGEAQPQAAFVIKVLVPIEGEDPASAPLNLCVLDPVTGASRGLQRVALGDESTSHWHYRWPATPTDQNTPAPQGN